MLQDPEGGLMSATWLDETYAAIRKHPITPDTTWLMGAAASLAVMLTTAYARIEELERQLEPEVKHPRPLVDVLAEFSGDEA